MPSREKEKAYDQQRGAFTILELLVVISVITLLAGLLLPALKNARESAKRSSCVSNMRQIYYSVNLYVNENNGLLPPVYGPGSPYSEMWMSRLESYGVNAKVLFCPSDPNFISGASPTNSNHTKTRSYIWNFISELASSVGQSADLWKIENANQTILMGEKQSKCADHYLSIPAEDPAIRLEEKRHKNVSNYLFVDGHVEALPPGGSFIPNQLWTIDSSD